MNQHIYLFNYLEPSLPCYQ